jgi:hypothetical protein
MHIRIYVVKNVMKHPREIRSLWYVYIHTVTDRGTH